jgi:hypothetical protein
MYLIGIDPGVNTGFAISKDGKIINVKTVDFWDCIKLLRDMQNMGIVVYVENPNVNKPVFYKRGANNTAMMQRVAQNVGSNKRDATLIIDFCTRNGIDVRPQTPQRGAKDIDAKYFQLLTGYDKSTSQHGRDAGMLIAGRTF